jgi:hypothetical protein
MRFLPILLHVLQVHLYERVVILPDRQRVNAQTETLVTQWRHSACGADTARNWIGAPPPSYEKSPRPERHRLSAQCTQLHAPAPALRSLPALVYSVRLYRGCWRPRRGSPRALLRHSTDTVRMQHCMKPHFRLYHTVLHTNSNQPSSFSAPPLSLLPTSRVPSLRAATAPAAGSCSSLSYFDVNPTNYYSPLSQRLLPHNTPINLRTTTIGHTRRSRYARTTLAHHARAGRSV